MTRSVSVNNADWNAQPLYSYRMRDIKYKLDSDGHARSRQTKTYQVLMLDGTPYNRLVESDGEPLSRAAAQVENQKLEQETSARQQESGRERSARISKYREMRSEEHLLMQQMVAAFQFRFVREETVEGFPCLLFNAMPNPAYQPPVEKARVLAGMRGQIWIDKAHFHWVKVHAEVTEPVEFGFFLAKVKPGTSFELEQSPLGDVWLPKRFVQTVNASVLGLYGLRSKEEFDYFDYAHGLLVAGSESTRAHK